jgi:hypothetical protein
MGSTEDEGADFENSRQLLTRDASLQSPVERTVMNLEFGLMG